MSEMKSNVSIVWNGGIAGNGTIKADYLDTEIAVPISLNGTGKGTDPKELLISSAATCYITTLAAILENRKLSVEELTMNTITERIDERLKITHHPHVILSTDATEKEIQSAERALEGADRVCEVGNLLKKAGVAVDFTGKVSLQ